MAQEVLLPKQGNSVESCIIIEWSVDVGDTVTEGQTLCEVETDKATFEVESTASGTVLKLLYDAGDEAPVMKPIAIVGEKGEQVDVSTSADAGGATPPSPAVTSETDASPAAGQAAGAGQPAAGQSFGPGQPASGQTPAGTGSPAARTPSGKLRISPRARQQAERCGVDPQQLSGSGPGGRILVRDVEQAIAEGTAQVAGAGAGAAPGGQPVGAGAAGPGGTATGSDVPFTGAPNLGEPAVAGTTPLRGIRAVIAERMHASLRDTAQLTMDMTADARGLKRLRARFKESAEQLGLPSVSIGEMVAFAAARTLMRHPGLNSHMQTDSIIHYRDVHLGLAVDTDRGLMVPTIRGANARSLSSLAEEGRRLAAAARDGSISPDELTGATFTITNLGATGVNHFTPVLNPPQVAILGVGGIRPEPHFIDDPATAGRSAGEYQVEHIPVIGLSLTIDHRAVDGAPASRFLKDLCDAIAAIELTLAI